MKNKTRKIVITLTVILIAAAMSATALAATFSLTGLPTQYNVMQTCKDTDEVYVHDLMSLWIGGKAVFCTQPGYGIWDINKKPMPPEGGKINVEYDISSVVKDDSLQNKIAYLGYYNLEEPTLKDYAFAAMYIWQSIPAAYNESTGTDTKGRPYSYFTDEKLNEEYLSWKSSISRKITSWPEKPSFCDEKINIKAGESITISDTKGVLCDYNAFEYSEKGINVFHEAKSNELKVSADLMCSDKNVIMSSAGLKDAGAEKYSSDSPVNYVYSSSSIQNLKAFGKTVPVPLSFEFVVELKGKVKIIKEDDHDNVSGIAFEIRSKDGVFSDTAVTDEEGNALIENLDAGEYVINEVLPAGYVKQEAQEVTVKQGETAYICFKNRQQEIRIHIKKMMEKDPYGELQDDLVKNVRFGLYKADGSEGISGQLNDRIQLPMAIIETDSEGTGVYIGRLDAGRYYIKETSTDEHYVISEKKYEFTVGDDKTGSEYVDIMINDGKTISNLYTKCRIDIIKMDKDCGELLENTGFSLCNDKGKEISRGYTDSEGKLSFENLPEGTYYIREFKACEGYRKDESVHQVILSKENREKKLEIANEVIPAETPDTSDKTQCMLWIIILMVTFLNFLKILTKRHSKSII